MSGCGNYTTKANDTVTYLLTDIIHLLRSLKNKRVLKNSSS